MSLRLLLADESPSIKKAFELALQDFNVEIKVVHEGSHVKQVFENFKPDISFLDVLLSKVNGYDSSKLLKTNAPHAPIVLMWNSFMELDTEKYDQSQADENIEKPFDSAALRKLVRKYVPHLQGNQISNFLSLDDETGSLNEQPLNLSQDEQVTTPPLSVDNGIPPLNDDLFDTPFSDLEDIPKAPSDIPDLDQILNFSDSLPNPSTPDPINELDEFELKDLTEELPPEIAQANTTSPLNLDPVSDLPNLPPVPVDLPDQQTEKAYDPIDDTPDSSDNLSALEPDETSLSGYQDLEESPEELPKAPSPKQPEVDDDKVLNFDAQFSKDELKRLILTQSKDIIESVVWDIVPELAKEMIQKEIKRLTGNINYNEDFR